MVPDAFLISKQIWSWVKYYIGYWLLHELYVSDVLLFYSLWNLNLVQKIKNVV